MTHFLIIRQEFLDLIPSTAGKACRQAASALLNFFRNQRAGWLTLNLTQLHDTLLKQWGKETVRRAAEVLADCGLIERKHHRMNGRAWQYRLKLESSLKEVTATPKNATVIPDAATVTSDSVTVAQDNATSIYKDPSIKIPFSDQQQDPATEATTAEVEKEIQKIKKIQCTPGIEINHTIIKEIKENLANVEGAIAYTKEAIATWSGANARQYNWGGVLVGAIQNKLVPKFERQNIAYASIPEMPTGLKDWVAATPMAREAFYSSFASEWRIAFRNGTQKAASEVLRNV